MSDSQDEYVRQLMDPHGFLAIMSYQIDYAIWHGHSAVCPIADWLSDCCRADTYVQHRDYYAGYPTCNKCDRYCDLVRVPRVKGVRVV